MPRVEVERDSYYTEFHRTPEGDGPSTAYATATGRSALELKLAHEVEMAAESGLRLDLSSKVEAALAALREWDAQHQGGTDGT